MLTTALADRMLIIVQVAGTPITVLEEQMLGFILGVQFMGQAHHSVEQQQKEDKDTTIAKLAEIVFKQAETVKGGETV